MHVLLLELSPERPEEMSSKLQILSKRRPPRRSGLRTAKRLMMDGFSSEGMNKLISIFSEQSSLGVLNLSVYIYICFILCVYIYISTLYVCIYVCVCCLRRCPKQLQLISQWQSRKERKRKGNRREHDKE